MVVAMEIVMPRPQKSWHQIIPQCPTTTYIKPTPPYCPQLLIFKKLLSTFARTHLSPSKWQVCLPFPLPHFINLPSASPLSAKSKELQEVLICKSRLPEHRPYVPPPCSSHLLKPPQKESIKNKANTNLLSIEQFTEFYYTTFDQNRSNLAALYVFLPPSSSPLFPHKRNQVNNTTARIIPLHFESTPTNLFGGRGIARHLNAHLRNKRRERHPGHR